ncbi:MAG: 4'-phosphopantetheinyl transferase superfamily protein [Clostridia bacterium]|nr:4'-phosphopantetheinyl transferase superfamily protein [Clostridia bacterium]
MHSADNYRCVLRKNMHGEKNSGKVTMLFGPTEIFCDNGEIFPKVRASEIESTRNEELKKQRFAVWRALEYALKKHCDADMHSLNFYKGNNGKWFCDRCFFSLSHTNGIIAAAVSDSECGVDVEVFVSGRMKESIAKKILAPKEYEEYSVCEADARERYLLKMWTRKESYFKMQNGNCFVPKKISFFPNTLSASVRMGEAEFFISVSSNAEVTEFFTCTDVDISVII